ncbi:hypothetical protein BDR03DRAFT_1028807 [Suillus americanus]|nr:hypothetical protein BDR03DRAFT_1028807 [Suillus americanus]
MYESFRRPRVHRGVEMKYRCETERVVSASMSVLIQIIQIDAARYLPTLLLFGPHSPQTCVEMAMFDSHPTSEYMPGSKFFVFNVGSPA